jgi:hypothetical protein
LDNAVHLQEERERERKSERDRERGKTKTRNMTYFSSTILLSMKCYAEAGKFAALARHS